MKAFVINKSLKFLIERTGICSYNCCGFTQESITDFSYSNLVSGPKIVQSNKRLIMNIRVL